MTASYCVETEWPTLIDVAKKELHMDYKRVCSWTTRKEDPLPARLIDGSKHRRVYRPELNAWLLRNSDLYAEK